MKHLSIIAFSLLFLFACSKDGDKNRPKITDLNINSETEDIVVQAGQTAAINFTVTDNEGLSQIRMDIHDAFDGHIHGKITAFDKFFWEQIDTLNGLTEYTGSINLNIPDSVAAGPYHLDVLVVDLEGNQSEIGLLDLIIDHSFNPEISITSHDFTNELHVDKGTSLILQGAVTDDIDLTEVFIVVEREDNGHTHGKTSGTEELFLFGQDLPGSSDLTYTINTTILIPGSAKDGDYFLEVVANDSDGNMSLFKGKLHIH
jgi:hypothetical protein